MSEKNATRFLLIAILTSATAGWSSVFGDLRGSVLDPQQHAIKGARVTLHALASDFTRTSDTDDNGEFAFRSIPLGEYTVSVEQAGFAKAQQLVTVTTGNVPELSFQLQVAPVSARIDIVAPPGAVGSQSPTPTTLVSRTEIARAPGAGRSNSLSMITDFVPGAYMTHDQLHVRGGHQVSWLIDGVTIPNTNIASNVGPQVDPKDIDYLEVQRGGYLPQFGDRTYGVFNVIPRTGFERNRECELLITYGDFNQTNDQISFGSHSDKFAYYASVNGNRSDFGLATPTAQVIHDFAYGVGGFASLVYLPSSTDELRFIGSARGDHYQVPNGPDDQAAGIRDVEVERDALAVFSWIHTWKSGPTLAVSPFYHFNRANFLGGPADTPVTSTEKRDSQYAGGQIVLSDLTRHHNATAGLYGFFQHDNSFFGIQATDGSGLSLQERDKVGGNLEALFLEDQYKPASWLTLTGGVRMTHFSGSVSENAADPRVGVAIRVPRANIVFRGFYGRYYQAPPLSTVSGPLAQFALDQGFGFLPLHGERDEEYQFGVSVPVKGWVIDCDYFHTAAKNFFDHNAIGNSNVFFPLTIDRARISGLELTVHSPRIRKRAAFYVTYSHQRAEGQGAITGGLTSFSPPADTFFLDHDQRHTLNAGFDVSLPWRAYLASSIHYGSGFLDGSNPPSHLPGHVTLDLSGGKSFGESWSVAFHAINVADKRFLLDNSTTFGGTHFVDPRQFYVELRYRFHY
jgi:outer membrane cobalamin receptor